MTPIMDRLCKSGLKVAMLIAASRRLEDKVVVEEEDIIRAFYYVEQWMPHSLYLIDNMGQTTIEKQLQQIVKIVNTRPGILRSDLMRRFRLSSRQTDAIVQTLEQRGEIVAKKEGRAEKYYPHKVK